MNYFKEFNTKEEAIAFKYEKNLPIHIYEGTRYMYLCIDSHFEEEELSQENLDLSNLIVDETDPLHCKLYRYIESPSNSETSPPKGHDYIIGLTSKLFPKRLINKGEIQEVTYYSDEGLTDKILRVTIVYQRDPFGFALNRTTTREWMLENGTWHPDKKISKKIYDDLSQITEGIRRRGNIIKGLQKPILLYMMGILMPTGVTVPEIILMGRDFLKKHTISFNAFINESHKGIIEDIEAEANDPEGDFQWLNSPINSEQTIKDFILEAFNI